jgi:hypothetical protein
MDEPFPKHLWWERDSGISLVPYTEYIIEMTPDKIVFSGYFLLEDDAMPVERIFDDGRYFYHVEILEKKTLKKELNDVTPPAQTEEEEDANICFFPSFTIELRYRLIQKFSHDTEEYYAIQRRICRLEPEVQERNQLRIAERQDRELLAMMERIKRQKCEE